MLIGYTRVDDEQDEHAERHALEALDVTDIHVDKQVAGTHTALAARDAMIDTLRSGDSVVVTGLARLARSAAELGAVATTLAERGARLHIGGTVYDPTTDAGRTAFHLLTTDFPDFEAGIYRLRLSGPRAKAKAAGRYPGGKPKLTPEQRHAMFDQHEKGTSIVDLQETYGLSQSGVYKYLQQERARRQTSTAPNRGS